jgi:hypothetical protein
MNNCKQRFKKALKTDKGFYRSRIVRVVQYVHL